MNRAPDDNDLHRGSGTADGGPDGEEGEGPEHRGSPTEDVGELDDESAGAPKVRRRGWLTEEAVGINATEVSMYLQGRA